MWWAFLDAGAAVFGLSLKAMRIELTAREATVECCTDTVVNTDISFYHRIAFYDSEYHIASLSLPQPKIPEHMITTCVNNPIVRYI